MSEYFVENVTFRAMIYMNELSPLPISGFLSLNVNWNPGYNGLGELSCVS